MATRIAARLPDLAPFMRRRSLGVLLGLLGLACSSSGDGAGSAPGGGDCPAVVQDGAPRIDAALEQAWSLADTEVLVRVVVELVEQPTLEEFTGTAAPTEAQRVAFETHVREELQACTVALIESAGGQVEGQFAVSGNAILARLTRSGGLDVARYPDVALVTPAGALPPSAGSEVCSDLSEQGCAGRSDCRLLRAALYDEEADCALQDVPVGCVGADESGGGEPTWATTAGGQCVYFATNLVPASFLAASRCPSGAPDACE